MDHTSVRFYNYIENCSKFVNLCFFFVYIYIYIYSYINSFGPLPQLIEGSVAIFRLWHGSVISSPYLFHFPSTSPAHHPPPTHKLWTDITVCVSYDFIFRGCTSKAESSLSFQTEGIQWSKFFMQLQRELSSPQERQSRLWVTHTPRKPW